MNKVAAARIAALVKTAGFTPVQAALLVKAAADAKNVQARLEKEARFLGRMAGGAMNMLGGAARGAARRMPAVNRAYTTPGKPGDLVSPGGSRYDPSAIKPTGLPRAENPGAITGDTIRNRAMRMGFKQEIGPRQFSGTRLAQVAGGTAAAGGGAYVGYGHLDNDAKNKVGGSGYNPLTWLRGKRTEEDVFKHNMGQYNEQAGGLKAQIAQAEAEGDIGKQKALNEQLQSGNFGGSAFALGGLNPFASRQGSHYQGKALEQQKGLQGKYNAEVGKSGPQPGDSDLMTSLTEKLQSPDLLPQQAEAMQKQLDQVKARMTATPGTENDAARIIRERMQGPDGKSGAGMRFTPWKPPGATTAPAAAPAGPNPTGNWHLGSRPRTPGYAQGYVYNPQDYRAAAQSPNYWGPITAPGA